MSTFQNTGNNENGRFLSRVEKFMQLSLRFMEHFLLASQHRMDSLLQLEDHQKYSLPARYSLWLRYLSGL